MTVEITHTRRQGSSLWSTRPIPPSILHMIVTRREDALQSNLFKPISLPRPNPITDLNIPCKSPKKTISETHNMQTVKHPASRHHETDNNASDTSDWPAYDGSRHKASTMCVYLKYVYVSYIYPKKYMYRSSMYKYIPRSSIVYSYNAILQCIYAVQHSNTVQYSTSIVSLP